MNKKQLLIVTRLEDRSLSLFFHNTILSSYKISLALFQDSFDNLKNELKDKNFDLIYIRDPFSVRGSINDLNIKINWIINNFPQTKFIDNVSSIEDIYFEDKWIQYEKFKDFMPETSLLDMEIDVDWNKYLVKKRISSRAKGIVLNKENLTDDYENYILQDKLNIEKEFRIIAVNNKILPIATTKTLLIDKHNKTYMKTGNPTHIDEALLNFILDIQKKLKFDLVGYDVAKLKNGEYKLIEINRSPQFVAYYRETGINIAKKLLLHEN